MLINWEGVEVFFSYETPVAARLLNGNYVRTDVNYSRTTTRHINQWLDGVKADIKSQDYINKLLGETPIVMRAV